ncbi:MAG TPA: fructosamine kinase family protein [Dokdonella sp.]
MRLSLPASFGNGLHRLRLADGRAAIAKIRRAAPTGFFAAEARGLEALRDTRTLRVPQVFDVGAEAIVLEDLGAGHATAAHWQRAGTQLAQMHRPTGAAFGFDTDGWCGDNPQGNPRDLDGQAFFAQHRLLAQAVRAHSNGLLGIADLRRVEHIAARLSDWLPPMPAVLVHGDLWLGNLHACGGGELALIDGGAVHHGWAETDLSMLILFGEPPHDFFDAYEWQAGITRDWRERAPLYNLYHWLNHLNLFGAGYRSAVLAVMGRFG